jgi:hypothetical protein
MMLVLIELVGLTCFDSTRLMGRLYGKCNGVLVHDRQQRPFMLPC